MDAYHPGRVFSSIDQMGRYAYANQPGIAAWNMAQLATCLLPLMGGEAAIPEATEAVNRFAELYTAAYLRRFRAKLGLASEREGGRRADRRPARPHGRGPGRLHPGVPRALR